MGFFKNFKESVNPTPMAIDDLRSDIQPLVRRLHESDQRKFLAWCGAWGGALGDIDADEAVRGVLPCLGNGYERSDGPDGRGILILTDERLMFMGQLGRLEIPLHQIGMSNWGISGDEGICRVPSFEVGVGPSNDPHHSFALSTMKRESWEPFIDTFETVIRDAERGRHAPAVAQPAPSSADELAKFARLRDQGVISEAEFQQKKERLLE